MINNSKHKHTFLKDRDQYIIIEEDNNEDEIIKMKDKMHMIKTDITFMIIIKIQIIINNNLMTVHRVDNNNLIFIRDLLGNIIRFIIFINCQIYIHLIFRCRHIINNHNMLLFKERLVAILIINMQRLVKMSTRKIEIIQIQMNGIAIYFHKATAKNGKISVKKLTS